MTEPRRSYQSVDWTDRQGRTWRLRFGFLAKPEGILCFEATLTPRWTVDRRLDTDVWRQVPLARLMDQAQGKLLATASDLAKRLKGLEQQKVQFWADQAPGGPGRRPTYGVEHYRQVARIYLTNSTGLLTAPTKAVAEHWQVKRSTANKWVARARELGFLAPAQTGRPRKGEKT